MPPTPALGGEYDCNFQESMCDWTKIYHDEDEEFRWRRERGKDLDDEALSGPNGDRNVVNRRFDDYLPPHMISDDS